MQNTTEVAHGHIRWLHPTYQATTQIIDALADHFKRKPAKAVEQVLAALEVLGQAKQEGETWQWV